MLTPQSRAADAATGQTLGGRYRLNRFVAGGVMGEVWEASDSRMDRIVAVKILRANHVHDPIALERFRYEARLGAQLDHPGIVKVHDVNAGGAEPPWLVQEFVAGASLSTLIERDGAMDAERAVHLVGQAAEAAHAAHEYGVVHRDLTPRNLMVTPDDVVKVTDFGIARTEALPSLTMTGQVVGTPAYLSPEQVRGLPAGPASDIYALAVVLYECLAGVRPFRGTNPIEVARAHLDYAPPLLPTSIPSRLAAIVMASMSKDPATRPTSAAEFARQLRGSLAPAPAAPDPVVNTGTHLMPAPAPPVAARHTPSVPTADRPVDQLRNPGGLAGGSRRRRERRTSVHPIWQSLARLTPTARETWKTARPVIEDAAYRAWLARPVTRAGFAGLAVLVVAVAAALVFSDTGAGGPR